MRTKDTLRKMGAQKAKATNRSYDRKSTYSYDGPVCPYCGRAFVPDDPIYYDERLMTEIDCDECGKKFGVEVYNSVSWHCRALEKKK